MFEDYIGKWVVDSNMDVDYDRIMQDLVIINMNPREFIFSYEQAVEVASKILDKDPIKIKFETHLFILEESM